MRRLLALCTLLVLCWGVIASDGAAGAAKVSITEFTVPTAAANPRHLGLGPDHNVWFTEEDGNNIGRITPSGTITEFPVPTASVLLHDITLGADGNMWFAEENGNQIGRITPAGTITEFHVPSANSRPRHLALGADGNVWFTE